MGGRREQRNETCQLREKALKKRTLPSTQETEVNAELYVLEEADIISKVGWETPIVKVMESFVYTLIIKLPSVTSYRDRTIQFYSD